MKILLTYTQGPRDFPSIDRAPGRQLQPNHRYLPLSSPDVIARGFEVSMRIAKLGEQLATADPLRQTERCIASGIRSTLDFRYLPDRDGKA